MRDLMYQSCIICGWEGAYESSLGTRVRAMYIGGDINVETRVV